MMPDDPGRTVEITASWEPAYPEATGAGRGETEPTARIGRFVVLRRVGAGGMGVVFEAYDPELDRKVALKLLHGGPGSLESGSPEALRLMREAQAMAQLSHPHVITVYDVGTHAGQIFIAMEYVDGADLCQWVQMRQRPWREVLATFLQAGEGLGAAHAAGLVHRDFKPANVLVGRDGRVRVLDFGLARPTSEQRASDEPTPAAASLGTGLMLASPLTVPGAIVGTPAYMAPEQLSGQDVDPRADQYAFAVALYEALYRQRPFAEAADSVDLLLHGRGQVLPPPGRHAVPARVWRVLQRSLALDPADRHASMSELLGALRKASVSPARAWGLAAGAVALVVTLALLAGREGGVGAPCAGGAERWSEAWNAERSATVSRAFAASGSPLAAAAFERVAATLDQYGRAWVDARTEACLATHARHEQSAELLDLRMVCLDRRWREAAALVALLERADASLVVEAPKAALALRSLDGCADPEALTAPVPLAPDARTREAAARLGDRLARAQAAMVAGRLAAALGEARDAVKEAHALKHEPLLAEALLLLGDILERSGEYTEASDVVRQALLAAQRGRHEEAVVRSLALLIWVDGYDRQQPEAYETLAMLGDATVERLGGSELLRAELAQSYGSALQVNRRLDEALEQFRVATELRAARLGAAHYLTAAARNNTATALYLQGRHEEGLVIHQDVLAAIEAALGPEHPSVAVSLDNVGACLSGLGRRAEARVAHARALAIRRTLFGDDNVQTAASLANVAELDRVAGRHGEAVEAFRQVSDVFMRRLGASHPYLAYPEVGLGRCHLEQGDLARAVPLLESGVARMGAGGVFSPADLAEARFALAQALWRSGHDRDRARSLASEAIAGLDPAGPDAALRRKIEPWLAGR